MKVKIGQATVAMMIPSSTGSTITQSSPMTYQSR